MRAELGGANNVAGLGPVEGRTGLVPPGLSNSDLVRLIRDAADALRATAPDAQRILAKELGLQLPESPSVKRLRAAIRWMEGDGEGAKVGISGLNDKLRLSVYAPHTRSTSNFIHFDPAGDGALLMRIEKEHEHDSHVIPRGDVKGVCDYLEQFTTDRDKYANVKAAATLLDTLRAS